MEGYVQYKIRRSFGKREIGGEAWLLDNLHKAEMSEKEKHDDDEDDDNDTSLTWLVV